MRIYIIEIEVPAGTREALEKAGARAKDQPQLMEKFSDLPVLGSGQPEKVHLKWERGSLNYGMSSETKELFEVKSMKVVKTKR